MFRNTPLAGTPTFKLIMGLGFCTLGGAMLYIYFKNRDEDEEREEQRRKMKDAGGLHGRSNGQKVKEVKIEFVVPNEHVPLMAGRACSNLKAVQEATHTKIHFREKDDKNHICMVTGFPDDVKAARVALLREVSRAPIVKEEIFVSFSVCGRITGRGAETMQEISRFTLAKVAVDCGGRNGSMEKRRITITGNREQVNAARRLIEAIIEEDEEQRHLVETVEQRREPRRSPTNSLTSSQTSLSSQVPPREKLLAARTDETPMEVYVSATATPGKFWVQLVGPQSKRLDDLVAEMTQYYGSAESREMHKIAEPYLGQIVAAMFKYDQKWYRAEIVGILPNSYNNNEVTLDLYFVDYGDSEYVKTNEVYELRTDFLTLRFQAVECFLANVKSTNPNDPNFWPTQSVQKFEDFTQVATWKKLISRVVTYKERPKAPSDEGREGSPIPGVELFDISEGMEVNIGKLLIAEGYALPATDESGGRHHAAATTDTATTAATNGHNNNDKRTNANGHAPNGDAKRPQANGAQPHHNNNSTTINHHHSHNNNHTTTTTTTAIKSDKTRV